LVEKPGGDAIDRILNKQPLSLEGQVDLIIHVGTMLQRTPAHRIWAKEISKGIIPDAIEMVREHGHAYVQQITAAGLRSEEWAKSWLVQMEQSIEKLDGKPCEEAIEKMNDPFPSVAIVEALLSMTWRIVETSGPQLFLTSDNPAVYFRAEGYGLGGKETEIVMPISAAISLHGSRNHRHPNFSCVKARQKIVREINKRIVSQATRFVFTHDKAPWLAKLLAREDLGVLRIGW
jgi:Protein of unknown function (DUF4238)